MASNSVDNADQMAETKIEMGDTTKDEITKDEITKDETAKDNKPEGKKLSKKRVISSPRDNDRNCITGAGIVNDGDIKIMKLRGGRATGGNPITGEGYTYVVNTRDRLIAEQNVTTKW